MIKNVNAKGFKGLDFSQDLYPKTIICGPNGAGKSARSLAMTLAICGYIPGTGKTNPDILAAFGKAKLNVGININGTTLNRQWSKSPKGTVNQTFLVDRKKSGKDAFISALAEAGSPKIFDLSLFMDLSDQKKIDYLFNLFPPAGDVSELDDKITDISEKLNQKRRDIRDAENFVAKTMANRAQIDLPSGTLAETSGEIKSLENELSQAQEQLKKAEIAKAQADAKIKADAEAKEKAELAIKEAKDKADQDAKAKIQEAQNEIESEISRRAQPEGFKVTGQTGVRTIEEEFFPDVTAEHQQERRVPRYDIPGPINQGPAIAAGKPNGAAESIKKIIAAMESVACPICATGAAKMIAKSELRKHI